MRVSRPRWSANTHHNPPTRTGARSRRFRETPGSLWLHGRTGPWLAVVVFLFTIPHPAFAGHGNPERGMVPFCAYNTKRETDKQDLDIPSIPHDNFCCEVTKVTDPDGNITYEWMYEFGNCGQEDTDFRYPVVMLRLDMNAFTVDDENYPDASPTQSWCGSDSAKKANYKANPIGIPMEAYIDDAGFLTEEGFTFINGIFTTFDAALAQGVKIEVKADYGGGDVPKEYVLGCGTIAGLGECVTGAARIFGHLETLQEYLFNPSCPLQPGCDTAQDAADPCSESICTIKKMDGGSPVVVEGLYKRNFTALVSSMYMGVIGSPDGEWDESCWPDDWTTGLLADDNRAQLLEFGMAMLPGRKVTIRNPLIKNDYFDDVDRQWYLNSPPVPFDLTFVHPVFPDCELCPEFEALETSTLWPPGQAPPNPISTDYASNYLGYFDAAFTAVNNEACTIPGWPACTGKHPCAGEYSQENLNARQAIHSLFEADAQLSGQTAEFGNFLHGFPHTGYKCDTPFSPSSDPWSPTENGHDFECATSCDEIIESNAVEDYFPYAVGLYEWVDPTWYYHRVFDGCDASTENVDETALYAAYTGNAGLVENAEVRADSDLKQGEHCTATGQCSTGLVCARLTVDYYQGSKGQLVARDNCPSSTDTLEQNICIPPLTCVSSETGYANWMSFRSLSTLHGRTERNSDNAFVLQYLETQESWYKLYERLGYVLVVDAMLKSSELLVDVWNDGYAAPMYWRPIELYVREAGDGNSQTWLGPFAANSWDIRTWTPSCAAGDWITPQSCRRDTKTVHQLSLTLPYLSLGGGSYELGVLIPDPEPLLAADPRYAIKLANADEFDESLGINWIPLDIGTMEEPCECYVPQLGMTMSCDVSGVPIGSCDIRPYDCYICECTSETPTADCQRCAGGLCNPP